MLRYSIVIPVYNGEGFIAETFDSVLAQDSRSEWELILVDDGSTDRSGAICDEYAKKDSRVRVIHKENGGYGSALNKGTEEAQGEYMVCFPHDDIMKPFFLSAIDDVANKGADMILYSGGVRLAARPDESGADYFKRVIAADMWPETSFDGMVLRRAFLVDNDFRYDTKQADWGNEFDFAVPLYMAAKCVITIERSLLDHRMFPTSITHSTTPAQLLSLLKGHTKYYRLYPISPLVDTYCRQAARMYLFTREEAQPLIDFCEANDDILDGVTTYQNKIARTLFRTFGYYTGSKIFKFFVWCKRTLTGHQMWER